MKPYHLLLFFVVFTLTACNKHSSSQRAFEAKLLTSFCAFHIVQITDVDGKEQGMNWTDPSGKEFKNVFTVKNHCDFGKAGLKVGDRFKAVILDKPVETNCASCMGFIETPQLQWNIQVID